MKKVKHINTKALVQIVESSMNGMSRLNNIVVNKMLNNYGRGGMGGGGGRGASRYSFCLIKVSSRPPVSLH